MRHILIVMKPSDRFELWFTFKHCTFGKTRANRIAALVVKSGQAGGELTMRRDSTAVVAVISLAISSLTAAAEESTQGEMRSLDEQVQNIKSDVLGISKDLSLLEERLLFPSNTQVSVFVEVEADDELRLDAMNVEIDGAAVAHHIYSFKELDALRHGGVQRIYTGNVATGAHDITVSVIGKRANGKDFTSSQSFSFAKDVEPKLLGLTVSASSSGAAIELGNW